MAKTPKAFRRAHKLILASERARQNGRVFIDALAEGIAAIANLCGRMAAASSLIADGLCTREEMGEAYEGPLREVGNRGASVGRGIKKIGVGPWEKADRLRRKAGSYLGP